MYYVAGTGGRKINRSEENIAGEFRRRCNDEVAEETGRRCEFVFECLEELLEEALGERNRRRCDCRFVFECLLELLEEVLGEEENENEHCHKKC